MSYKSYQRAQAQYEAMEPDGEYDDHAERVEADEIDGMVESALETIEEHSTDLEIEINRILFYERVYDQIGLVAEQMRKAAL